MQRLLVLFIASVAIATQALSPIASATVVAADWRAGRIIDDAAFTNANAMTVGEIQSFLNARVPVCDTWGTQPSEYGGGTRAQYATSRGYTVPFTCLKDYYEVPKTVSGPTLPANNYGGKPIPNGAQSAAQLISNAAHKYNINPQVLLVKLATESPGPLTSDDWPFERQYLYAMGAHCPDSGPGGSANCDSNWAGFSLQMDEAASLLRWYLDSMTQSWWQYKKPYQVNSVLWNVAPSGCGAGDVYIDTKATAALYTYTPYQPNQAALNNMYGTGDGCSAYGNRNFWRVFSDWFNQIDSVRRGITMTNISQPDTTPARGQTVSYTYSLTNTLTEPVTFNAVGVAARQDSPYSGANRDFGWSGAVTLAAGATQQFTFSTTVSEGGNLYAWPAANYQGGYIQYNNWGVAMAIHEPNISLVSPLTSSVANPVAGQTVSLSATIHSNEDQPINLSAIGLPVRFYNYYAYDTGWSVPPGSVLPAGADKVVSGNVVLDKPGPFTAWVSGVIAGRYTTLSPTLNLNVVPATPKFILTYTETPNLSPAIGEDVAIRFKLKNVSGVPMTLDHVGVVGRYDSPAGSTNHDFGWVGAQSFTDGEEKSYTTFVKNITDLNKYYTWVAVNYQGSYIHYNTWGFTMTPRLPNITQTVPITVNNGVKPNVGQTVSVVATLKNNEPKPIRFNAIGIPIRFYGVYSYDTAWQGAASFAAAGQAGDTISLSGNVNFDKPGPYTLWTAMNIYGGNYITIGNTAALNL